MRRGGERARGQASCTMPLEFPDLYIPEPGFVGMILQHYVCILLFNEAGDLAELALQERILKLL